MAEAQGAVTPTRFLAEVVLTPGPPSFSLRAAATSGAVSYFTVSWAV